MTLLQALQGKLGPSAAEPALLQGVIQKLGKVQFQISRSRGRVG